MKVYRDKDGRYGYGRDGKAAFFPYMTFDKETMDLVEKDLDNDGGRFLYRWLKLSDVEVLHEQAAH